jgi:two-component system, chemotaxis family, sensor kinase CheA
MDISHLKQKFIDEAEVLLTSLDNVLIEFEKCQDIQYVNEIFRVVHTIKGASGMFGFEKIVEITHEIENLYDLVRNEQLTITPTLIQTTFSVADHIRNLLSDENCTNDDNIQHHKILINSIAEFKRSDSIAEKSLPTARTITEKNEIKTWHIIFYPDEELINRCVNMTYTFQDLFALGRHYILNQPSVMDNDASWAILLVTEQAYEEIENALMFVLDYCKIAKIADFDIFEPNALKYRDEDLNVLNYQAMTLGNDHWVDAEEKSQEIVKNLQDLKPQNAVALLKQTTTRITVEASKLDSLMYLVSELVTSKSELMISLQKEDKDKALAVAEKIEKLSKLFSENALSIRLVSLHEMMDRFKRLVRDLSKQLGKSIDFVIIGEDTELDKSILDAIGEPIMHLIRNNVDHGIESPEARIEMGKPATGTVRFEAFKTGNNVFINISDDGKGIDTANIYNKAIEKGFIKADAQLSPKEILNLIFLPGFSTAQSLTNVSGRGVGMDIVQKKLKEIRGEVSISSEVGKGTSFTIKLQQTISIIDTLLIKASKITYAIPVEDIEACLLEAHENIANRQSNLIVYNNELIPFVSLNNQFRTCTTNSENEKLIIIKKQNKRYAIIADSIIGEYQAVIKPLGKAFSNVHFLSGASLLGDGSIALLVDTDKLWYETAIDYEHA